MALLISKNSSHRVEDGAHKLVECMESCLTPLALVQALSDEVLAIGISLLTLLSNRKVVWILWCLFDFDILFTVDIRARKFDSK